jgi:hypothetical protein
MTLFASTLAQELALKIEIIENLIEDRKDMPQLPEWLGVYQTVVSANPITILPSSNNP